MPLRFRYPRPRRKAGPAAGRALGRNTKAEFARVRGLSRDSYGARGIWKPPATRNGNLT